MNTSEQITLVEDDNIITDELEIADIMVNVFTNVVDLLEIPENITDTTHIDDKVTAALIKYNTHPSIIKIKESNANLPIFKFNHTTVEVINDIIKNLNAKKASSQESIPTKILQINNDIFSPILCSIFNSGLDNNIFPSTLKRAEIKPVFKKIDRGNKENYRPVSLLKVCYKIIFRKLYQ